MEDFFGWLRCCSGNPQTRGCIRGVQFSELLPNAYRHRQTRKSKPAHNCSSTLPLNITKLVHVYYKDVRTYTVYEGNTSWLSQLRTSMAGNDPKSCTNAAVLWSYVGRSASKLWTVMDFKGFTWFLPTILLVLVM